MEFFKLELDNIESLRPFFSENPCRICDFTIGGTFMWRDFFKTQYAIQDSVLYLKVKHPSAGDAFTLPICDEPGRDAYERIINYCKENGLPTRICSVSEGMREHVLALFPDASSYTDRAWSDYLYYAEDIKTLSGRKFSGQRNHINRFMREQDDWAFERVTQGNIAAVRAFFAGYEIEHSKDSAAYEEGDRKAIEVIDNLELYGQVGGALFVGGKVVGASFGEVVNDTLYVHIEKADTAVHGAYPVLVNQFAKAFATEDVLFINREEDDGVEGLRTSKLSYHPTEILDKYIVELA